MKTVRHVTYNLHDYAGHAGDRETRKRFALVRDTLRATGGHVFSVQEIYGHDPAERANVFIQLASSLDLDCMTMHEHTGQRVPVFDPGRGRRGVGVMWRPDVMHAVPGSLRVYDHAGLGVGMAAVQLWVAGVVGLTVASTHWPPRKPRQRADEGVYVANEITGMAAHGIVGADWNNIHASQTNSGAYFDPDPYETRHWDPRYIGKARRNLETGKGVARREAMHELQDGGLFDPAAYNNAKWFRTTGHWDSAAIDKRIDGPMVTETVARATQAIGALDEGKAHHASPHLPVYLDISIDNLVNPEWITA